MWTPSNLSFFSDTANPSFHWSPASVVWVVTVCVCTIGLLVLTAISLRSWYLPRKKLEETTLESVTTIEASKLENVINRNSYIYNFLYFQWPENMKTMYTATNQRNSNIAISTINLRTYTNLYGPWILKTPKSPFRMAILSISPDLYLLGARSNDQFLIPWITMKSTWSRTPRRNHVTGWVMTRRLSSPFVDQSLTTWAAFTLKEKVLSFMMREPLYKLQSVFIVASISIIYSNLYNSYSIDLYGSQGINTYL